jgi:gamma-aminobutyric acid type B receptor
MISFFLGFSLAFGALFAKTWRVHAILTSPKKLKRHVRIVPSEAKITLKPTLMFYFMQLVQDFSLFMMVAALVLVDSIIFITWHIVDDFNVEIRNVSEPIVSVCKTQ